MMFSHSDTKVLTSHLRNLRILVLHLFLIHLCRGQFQLISSPQPVIALVGDDVILPCRLQPIIGASVTKVEWTKPGVHPKYIHIHQDGRLLYDIQNKLNVFTQERKNKQKQWKQRSEQKSKREVKHKLKTLRKNLETNRNQVRDKQAELYQLSEEKQRMKEELQTLNEELENKNQELKKIIIDQSIYSNISTDPRRSELQKKKEEVEQEVETLKKKVETKETEIQTKTEQFEEKQVELQQLQDKRQSTVTDLQRLEKELMFIKLEGGRTDISRQLKQEKEEMMREVERLNIQQESMKAEFENQLQAEQEAVAKAVLLKKQLQKKIKELDKQLSAEKQERMESEKEMKEYITELEKKLSVGTQLMLETGSLKKQLEKRNSELQKRIRAEEQKKMEIEILKSQLEKNNTQLQAEKQRREKEAAALKEEKVMKSNPGPGEEMDLTTVQSVEENHNEEEIQQKPTSDTVTDDISS